MVKKLTSVGNSLALIIDRPILDLLNITKETELDLKTDGENLLIMPVRKNLEERFAASAERIMEIHHETLRKLAE